MALNTLDIEKIRSQMLAEYPDAVRIVTRSEKHFERVDSFDAFDSATKGVEEITLYSLAKLAGVLVTQNLYNKYRKTSLVRRDTNGHLWISVATARPIWAIERIAHK